MLWILPLQAHADSQTPMLTATVRVTNERGEPVEGAAVKPHSLRARGEGGLETSLWTWNERAWGPMPSETTNARGVVRVRYPKYVVEELETQQITWLVDHAEYVVYFWKDHSVDEDPAEVVLKDGVTIAVRAVDETTGGRIAAPYAYLSGSIPGIFDDNWTLHNDGSLVSRPVIRERRMLRVMHLPDDGPALFSELIDLAKHPGPTIRLNDVRLRRGVYISGRIDPSVHRPVSNGIVTASAIGPRDLVVGNDFYGTWSWHEFTLIDPDGTFQLGWLPEGEHLHLFAVCDGFVSRTPTAEEMEAYRAQHEFRAALSFAMLTDQLVLPQLSPVTVDESNLSVRMRPTTVCRVRLAGPDGRPVEGATVTLEPRQTSIDWGSPILGDGFSHLRLLKAERSSGADWEALRRRHEIRFDPTSRYQDTSDADGIAEVANVPAGGSVTFRVEHAMFELPPPKKDAVSRISTIDLKHLRPAEVTVKLQAKGSQVIGRKE